MTTQEAIDLRARQLCGHWVAPKLLAEAIETIKNQRKRQINDRQVSIIKKFIKV